MLEACHVMGYVALPMSLGAPPLGVGLDAEFSRGIIPPESQLVHFQRQLGPAFRQGDEGKILCPTRSIPLGDVHIFSCVRSLAAEGER